VTVVVPVSVLTVSLMTMVRLFSAASSNRERAAPLVPHSDVHALSCDSEPGTSQADGGVVRHVGVGLNDLVARTR
jgi:hypothetical protein